MDQNHIRPKEKEMSFFEHLEELRWHVIRALIAILVVTILAFLNKDFVFDYVIFGPSRTDFPTYKLLCWIQEKVAFLQICIDKLDFEIINLELAGQFIVHLKSSLILGFVLAFPYIFWEVWRFVKPGLYKDEVKYSRMILFFGSMLFFIGVSFGYFILMPFAINFFSSYTVSSSVGNTFSLTNYLGFISMFVIASGILFELPMVVYFLSKMGLASPAMMRTYRKHAFIVILLTAAIITPADIGTQILVTVPVYILYELSIFISASVEKNRLKDQLK